MTPRLPLALMWMTLLLAPLRSTAADWQLAEGTLSFAGTQQEEPFEGVFRRFTVALAFDPASPEQARFDVRVDLASADSRQEERDSALAGPEWFDVATSAEARFTAQGARTDGTGFVVPARLTLRGVTKDLSFPFTWTTTDRGPRLRASVTLDRLDFGLGSGEWADPEWVGHAVRVDVDILLAPVPAPPGPATAPDRLAGKTPEDP